MHAAKWLISDTAIRWLWVILWLIAVILMVIIAIRVEHVVSEIRTRLMVNPRQVKEKVDNEHVLRADEHETLSKKLDQILETLKKGK